MWKSSVALLTLVRNRMPIMGSPGGPPRVHLFDCVDENQVDIDVQDQIGDSKFLKIDVQQGLDKKVINEYINLYENEEVERD